MCCSSRFIERVCVCITIGPRDLCVVWVECRAARDILIFRLPVCFCHYVLTVVTIVVAWGRWSSLNTEFKGGSFMIESNRLFHQSDLHHHHGSNERFVSLPSSSLVVIHHLCVCVAFVSEMFEVSKCAGCCCGRSKVGSNRTTAYLGVLTYWCYVKRHVSVNIIVTVVSKYAFAKFCMAFMAW